jgi:hypothetical protein
MNHHVHLEEVLIRGWQSQSIVDPLSGFSSNYLQSGYYMILRRYCMVWKPSRFVAGDLVEVRSKEEILMTLDQHGCVDGMPFMPEMFQFCGQRFHVRAVAHKTCDTIHRTGGRRLQSTVHLADLRCDGSAHGGCQAECSLFWKDVWLKNIDSGSGEVKPAAFSPTAHLPVCTEAQLHANTRLPGELEGDEPRYACQATKLYEATEPLAAWELRQYVLDVVTGNRPWHQVWRVVWLGSLRWLLRRVPFGYRLVKCLTEWMHQWLAGRTIPSLRGRIERGKPTPTGRLDLKPGEYVRIRSQEEIEQTLDQDGKNRGLGFGAEEMSPYCGKVVRVRGRVTKIIDEPTGKLLQMKHPCIILDGVICTGDYASHKLLCTRAIRTYWRDLWLERVEQDNSSTPEKDGYAPRVSGSTFL